MHARSAAKAPTWQKTGKASTCLRSHIPRFKIARFVDHRTLAMPSTLLPDEAPPTEKSLREYAATVFGGDAAGASWFEKPAMSLNQKRPSELMDTAEGRQMVQTALGRIDYSVYT